MDLSISSIFTMSILSSILIIILCLLFKSDRVMRSIGPSCMITVLFIVIGRMFLPFEFAYTYSIRIENILTPIRKFLIITFIKEPIEVTVWRILVFIWVAAAIGVFVFRIYHYKKFILYISLLSENSLEEICREYNLDTKGFEDLLKIRVVLTTKFNSPYLVGFRNPCIVLPKREYEKEQLYYIILHEVMHVRNKDIVWKLLIDLLCTFFWWNLVLVYLKKELFKLIEMRNDMHIVKNLSDEEQIYYMECLKNSAVQASEKDIMFGVGFSHSDFKELKRRMKLIANTQHFSYRKQLMLSVLVILLLFLSSSIIVEPFSDIEEGVSLTSDNTFLVENGDEYDVYVDGEFVFTTDDLRQFPDVKIYSNINEAQDERD